MYCQYCGQPGAHGQMYLRPPLALLLPPAPRRPGDAFLPMLLDLRTGGMELHACGEDHHERLDRITAPMRTAIEERQRTDILARFGRRGFRACICLEADLAEVERGSPREQRVFDLHCAACGEHHAAVTADMRCSRCHAQLLSTTGPSPARIRDDIFASALVSVRWLILRLLDMVHTQGAALGIDNLAPDGLTRPGCLVWRRVVEGFENEFKVYLPPQSGQADGDGYTFYGRAYRDDLNGRHAMVIGDLDTIASAVVMTMTEPKPTFLSDPAFTPPPPARPPQ